MAENRNSMTFEDALEGKHGDEARQRAEAAIHHAIEQIAAMVGPQLPAGASFASGGLIKPQRRTLVGECSGEYVIPRPR